MEVMTYFIVYLARQEGNCSVVAAAAAAVAVVVEKKTIHEESECSLETWFLLIIQDFLDKDFQQCSPK